MKKILHVFILLLCGLKVCYSQNTVTFEKEDITFEIKDSIFIIQGLYYFHSEQEKKYSILYPFPTDSIYSPPFNIHVEYINSGETIVCKKNKDSSSIAFQVLIHKEQPILISYHQKLKSNKAKYILMSTRHRDKPLKQVNFKLVTESDFVIKSFSILPDKQIQLIIKKCIYGRKNILCL